MKTPDRDAKLADSHWPDEAPDALDRLIAELRVPVAQGFSRQVMGRIEQAEAPRARSAQREWAIAASLAAALAALAAVLVASGGEGEPGVATSILDLLASTLAAGAGFLAASWRGLGQTVSAALGGSATAIVVLGLAALAANGLLLLLLRRRRVVARSRDDS